MYGEGVRIWLCHVEDHLFQKMDRARRQLPWESVLFDLDFLAHFGFQHWSELAKNKEQIGFYLTDKNIIEIKQGNKRLSRFYAIELISTNLLFPIYNTNETQLKSVDDCSFVLLEYETGLVISYSVETDWLVMDDLTFELMEMEVNLVIIGVDFRGNSLNVTKTDTVMRGNKVISLPTKTQLP